MDSSVSINRDTDGRYGWAITVKVPEPQPQWTDLVRAIEWIKSLESIINQTFMDGPPADLFEWMGKRPNE
jgi:hypothetical protein